MREKRFAVLLPEEVVAGFGWTEEEVPSRVREVLVIALLRRHAVSQRKAAELLHLNLRELFEVMGPYKVPTIDLTPEELQRELHQGTLSDCCTGFMPLYVYGMAYLAASPVLHLCHCMSMGCQSGYTCPGSAGVRFGILCQRHADVDYPVCHASDHA